MRLSLVANLAILAIALSACEKGDTVTSASPSIGRLGEQALVRGGGLLTLAEEQEANEQWVEAFFTYQYVLRQFENDASAMAGRDRARSEIERRFDAALRSRDTNEASRWLEVIDLMAASKPTPGIEADDARLRLSRLRNAPEIKESLAKTIEAVSTARADGEIERATALLIELAPFPSDNPSLDNERRHLAKALLAAADEDLSARRLSLASRRLALARALDILPDEHFDGIDASLHDAREREDRQNRRKPEAEVAVGVNPEKREAGTTFRDCAACPELVVVPPGEFLMGSPADEEGRLSTEGPRHRVRIDYSLAVGRFEVTFSEWDACVSDGGCDGYQPDDRGWGRERRPVINVSWISAQAYVNWLSRKTGERYRLLSESEWEYAARAGTETPFHFGGTIGTDQANYNGNVTYGHGGRKGEYRRQTVPVGSFAANDFGLHDVHGNVPEWVEDCWHDDYRGALSDGSAWTTGCDPKKKVIRSGIYAFDPATIRSAWRSGVPVDLRISGLRVARAM